MSDSSHDSDAPETHPICRRRDCDNRATFRVLERYLEETGQGPVEAEALLCQAHTEEESPTHLDDSFEGYVFRVEPLTS